MTLFELIKSTKDFAMLEKEAASGNLSQAILLQSQDTFYASEFAKILAMLILDKSACRNCENCQKVLASSHPDVKKYPLKDKLLVSDSEEIVSESFVKPIFADKKIFIIENIDSSTDSAQNKLLKTLEEPSKNVYLILTCKSIDMVLPTIRSRCNKIGLSSLDKNDISGFVNDSLALSLCEGMIGKAVELSKKDNLEEIFENALSVVCKMKNSKEVLFYANKILDKKGDAKLALEIIALALEDLMKIKSGQKNLVRLNNSSELEEVASEYSVRALCEISFLLDKLLKEKAYNTNFTLAVENFLLNILEVKYLCR